MRGVAGTEPYPWPWDGPVDPARLALVVVGADSHWQAHHGGSAAMRNHLVALAEAVRAAGAPVVQVRHDPLAGDRGVTAFPAAEQVVVAAGLDGFYGSALDLWLRRAGRDQLLITGFGLEGPVHSTLRGANDRGYECLLVTDACSPIDPGTAGAAAAMVTMSGGIFGAVGTTAAVLAALDEFRSTSTPSTPSTPSSPTEEPHDRDLVR